jgi:hypothetical protein
MLVGSRDDSQEKKRKLQIQEEGNREEKLSIAANKKNDGD